MCIWTCYVAFSARLAYRRGHHMKLNWIHRNTAMAIYWNRLCKLVYFIGHLHSFVSYHWLQSFVKQRKKRKHISRVTKVLPFHIGTFDLFEREKNKYRQSFLSICIIYTEGSPEYSISNFLNGIFTFTVTNSNKIERQNEWTAEERQVQIENACTHTNNSLQ